MQQKNNRNLPAGKILMAVFGCALLVACISGPREPEPPQQSVSIPYDPYNFNPYDLDDEAQAHCEAYGLNAVFEDETIDNNSVRWRYRHYRCI